MTSIAACAALVPPVIEVGAAQPACCLIAAPAGKPEAAEAKIAGAA